MSGHGVFASALPLHPHCHWTAVSSLYSSRADTWSKNNSQKYSLHCHPDPFPAVQLTRQTISTLPSPHATVWSLPFLPPGGTVHTWISPRKPRSMGSAYLCGIQRSNRCPSRRRCPWYGIKPHHPIQTLHFALRTPLRENICEFGFVLGLLAQDRSPGQATPLGKLQQNSKWVRNW